MSVNTGYDIGKAFDRIENELIASMIRNIRRHKVEEIKEENLALRSRGREEVAKSGYDIMTEAKKLDRFYEKRLEGRR